jgi:DNA-binding MarR family transcriptional regulator
LGKTTGIDKLIIIWYPNNQEAIMGDDARLKEVNKLIQIMPKLYRFFHGFRVAGFNKDRIGLARFKTLFELSDHKGGTLKELAGILHVTSATLSPLIESLVREQLVDRIADEKDRRCVRLSITSKGVRALEKSQQMQAEQWIKMLAMMSPENAQQMLNSLETLAKLCDGMMKGR